MFLRKHKLLFAVFFISVLVLSVVFNATQGLISYQPVLPW